MHRVSYHKAEPTLRKIRDKIQSNYKLDPRNYSWKKDPENQLYVLVQNTNEKII